LRSWLGDQRIVAVFSRLHPLLSQQALLAGLGQCQVRSTVSVDLTLPADQQRARYRRSHKAGINRLRRSGLTCLHDRQQSFLRDFVWIYHETMRRVEAPGAYFFPAAYFEELAQALGPRLQLFVCLQDGRAICGGLFVACGGILQYHLGGTRDEALKLSPMKLLVDEVRLWATSQGLRVFHLGGGITAHPDDSLLFFKTGFSDRKHQFFGWRWVVLPDVYGRLCESRWRWNEGHGLRSAHPDYFPAYRSPTVPCGAPSAGSAATSR
jgi:hypothetical protein